MTTIALDPGISTGVAIHKQGYDHDGQAEPAASIDEYLMLVVTDVPKLWELLQHHKPHTIVIENFASGGLISKDGQATIRLIGAMELAAHLLGARLILQFPSERRPFMPAARAMLIQRGKTPISHEVDALSHLLCYEKRLEDGVLDQIVSRRRQTWT